MLSICIPTYNYIPTSLVKKLSIQANEIQIEFEIIIFNDGSNSIISTELRSLLTISGVKIESSVKNIGRATARNRLGKLAKYPYILFIDSDSDIPNKDYLKTYINNLNPGIVCCGGTKYYTEKPQKQYILRWKYGHSRESISGEDRSLYPWNSFTTHHFVIDRELFLKILFSTKTKGYGHEDTLFGIELKNKNIPIKHINNPLFHIGLESANTYILKTENALINLKLLFLEDESSEYYQSIKLIRFYKKQKNLRLIWVWKTAYLLFNRMVRIQLSGNNPNLRLFDFYKLGYFICIKPGIKANEKI
jgi:glycosyltransferase involved in cell wall biosynthesis